MRSFGESDEASPVLLDHCYFDQVRIVGEGKIEWVEGRLAASDYIFEAKVAGDTNPRFQIRADGRIEWGGGADALDTRIYRGAAYRVDIYSNLFLNDGDIWAQRNLATARAIRANIAGDTQNRFLVDASGLMSWGPGNAVQDCQLFRRAANILNTPDRMEMGTLGVGNSAAGDVTATAKTNKIEVFDDAGASLGYLQTYAGA